MAYRACKYLKENGEPCGAPPLQESDFCLMHDPEHTQEVAEGRRLGGLRRRRERTLSGAFEFEGVGTIKALQRVVEIALIDALSMENSLARSRTLAYLVMVGAKLVEVGDHEERLTELEQLFRPRLQTGGSRR